MAGYGASFSNRLGLIQGMGDDANNRTIARRQAILARQSSPMVGNDSSGQSMRSVGGSLPAHAPHPGHSVNEGGSVSNGKWTPGSMEALYAFGDEVKGMGYRVGENSRYNGGKKVTGGHSRNSQHYHDEAIDINWAAGTSPAEQAKLRALDDLVAKYGLNSIFMAPGHYGHRHVSIPRRR